MEIKKILTEFKIPIGEILIAPNLLAKAANLIEKFGFDPQKILLICDQNTYPIAQKILSQINCATLILQNPKADYKTVLKITNQAPDKKYNLIIAVGSGVINDLCKVASHQLKISYLIFGTAPSMNGYASANASIVIKSHKTSIPAHLPIAIYLDLDVLTAAPLRLIKSGIGDSLCFSTCQFDWLLSHLILETFYSSVPFDLLLPYYQKLIGCSSINDINFIQILAETLIISGLGMYISGGSYPASQAEHLIAHYIEILYPKIAEKSYHGEQIAICTLSVLKLQEKILQQENLQIKETNFDQNNLEKIFNKELSDQFVIEINKKKIDKKAAQKINQNLQKNWQNIKAELEKIFISKNELLESYKKFALPKTNQEIGFEDKIYNQALTNAHLIRNRFTILDLTKIIL